MKRFDLLVILVLLMLALQHSPVLAQNTVNGLIARVTQNGVQLKDGMSYRWADNFTTTLANGNDGGWADLQTDDVVRLGLNGQNRVTSVVVTGRNTGQRVERSLTELKPVEGDWKVEQNVTIAGRVFEVAGTMSVDKDFNPTTITRRIVFSNPGGYDLLEVWIGFRGGRGKGKNKFSIRGDGDTLFTSEWMEQRDQPVKVSVAIKGYTGISLIASGDEEVGYYDTAVWANPVLVKMPASVPNIVSPSMNARITRNTPLVWEAVDGATGYLLELQAVSLNNTNDANSENRFLLLRLPADTTVYNFNVNQMPRGKWRWRVHSLNDTGFLGEMTDWKLFTAQ